MNQRWKFSLLVLIIVGVFATASSQEPQLSAEDLARGKQLFVSHCAYCHGIEGTGGRGPALNQPNMRKVKDRFGLFLVIKTGLQGTEMPMFWQLSDNEIRQVAGYVWSMSRTAEVKLPGDSSRGKSLYESKGGCAVCHIIGGKGESAGPDLTEVGARRSAAYLRDALINPGASAPEGFLIITAVTRDGRRLRGTRVNEDSFTIQIRDAKNVFHSLRKSDIVELKREFGASTMPSYKSILSDSEMDDLVAYLASLRGEK
jgi:putative heme-binding domain-containing protein